MSDQGTIELLKKSSSSLNRAIQHLDKCPVRETVKIGVVYVGPNQKNQREILHNSSPGSDEFEQFVVTLGWPVDLSVHKGFSGGLDCNPEKLTCGRYAPYFCTTMLEVLFHVVTWIPTQLSDEQQINKKRHIGNDHVHIVWSDNRKRYLPQTIPSQFNDVQIVIYPLSKSCRGLYQIQINSKPKLAKFGPLQDGMIVSKAMLAPLVRQTAINANRRARELASVHTPPFRQRQQLIREIGDKYSVRFDALEVTKSTFPDRPNFSVNTA